MGVAGELRAVAVRDETLRMAAGELPGVAAVTKLFSEIFFADIFGRLFGVQRLVMTRAPTSTPTSRSRAGETTTRARRARRDVPLRRPIPSRSTWTMRMTKTKMGRMAMTMRTTCMLGHGCAWERAWLTCRRFIVEAIKKHMIDEDVCDKLRRTATRGTSAN